MAFFTGCILSLNGRVIVEYVEIWINTFRFGTQDSWYGSFEASVIPALNAPAYRLQLADGRERHITPLATWLRGDNVMVYFEGSGPLTAGA